MSFFFWRYKPQTKAVIISGASRSGKSHLGKIIAERYNLVYLSGDEILSKFNKIFPELNISPQTPSNSYRFLVDYLKISLLLGVRFVFEGVIPIKLIYKNFSRRNVFALGVGYPDISLEEKMEQLKLHDTKDDWSLTLHNDQQFCNFIKEKIKRSEKIRSECRRYFFHFMNVSYNRDGEFQKVIEKLDKIIGR
jgi:hypothetical protein